jgi:hypothetical protein
VIENVSTTLPFVG